MSSWYVTGWNWRLLKAIIGAFVDSVPPYRWVEGRLEAKEIGPGGLHYLLVDNEMVQVDWVTFDTLMDGEALRIRCTRDYKAISIDRLSP